MTIPPWYPIAPGDTACVTAGVSTGDVRPSASGLTAAVSTMPGTGCTFNMPDTAALWYTSFFPSIFLDATLFFLSVLILKRKHSERNFSYNIFA